MGRARLAWGRACAAAVHCSCATRFVVRASPTHNGDFTTTTQQPHYHNNSNSICLPANMQPGQHVYKGVPRHRDPVVCPQRALAAYFWARFVKGGELFPDPRDNRSW